MLNILLIYMFIKGFMVTYLRNNDSAISQLASSDISFYTHLFFIVSSRIIFMVWFGHYTIYI